MKGAFLGKIYFYEKNSLSPENIKEIVSNLDDQEKIKIIIKNNLGIYFKKELKDFYQKWINLLSKDKILNLNKEERILISGDLENISEYITKIKDNSLRQFFEKFIDIYNIKIFIKSKILEIDENIPYIKNGSIPKEAFENLKDEKNIEKCFEKLEKDSKFKEIKNLINSLKKEDFKNFEKIIKITEIKILERLKKESDYFKKILSFLKLKYFELNFINNLSNF